MALAEQIASFAGDAWASFRRNGLMTAAAVTTIMVALLVVGAALLIGLNLAKVARSIEDQVQVVAFLRDGATAAEVAKTSALVGTLPGVASVRFVARDEALHRLQDQLKEGAAFADLVATNPLPDSLEVRLRMSRSAAEVAEAVARYPIVTEVTYGGQVVDRLVALTRAVRAIAALLTVFLTAVALVVVVNTVRLTVIARRQEIEIMQLVGATRWFVRWPFLIEGLLQGGTAAVGAFLALAAVYTLGVVRLAVTMPFLPLAGVGESILPLLGWLVAAGLSVGMAGSVIAVRRFLVA